MKRKIWSFMLATLLLVASVVNVGASGDRPNYSDYQFTTTYACNVRAGTSTDYRIIASLPHGHIAYSDHSSSAYVYSQERWIDLTVSNGWGWVRADLVCPSNACYVVTTQAGVHLRALATVDCESLGILPYGTYVEVLGTLGEFYHVMVRSTGMEGTYGYVSTQFVHYV
ncbi:MAG: SH3 domain-containing protein [Ruminococcaceae bacterium]|nr:SH3 domain-containing protein [Oscillospiraceae bacterium]